MTRIRKNSEKRKAKSRDAARVRRSTESDIFSEISSFLPFATQNMDKISIVRLAAAYLRTASCLGDEWNDWNARHVRWDGREVGNAVEGIPVLVSGNGSIAFVSEAIDSLLGLSPLDLMGNSIYDYVHLCDHRELDELLCPGDRKQNGLAPAESGFRHKFIRVKNTLTTRGKRVNLSQATYRVLRFSGKYLGNGMVLALMETLPNACTVIDRFLGRQVILSKHSLDMRFTQIDKSQCESIFGFSESDIVGTSFYQYFHPLDAPVVESSLRDLYAKGQVETPAYRFLAKDGSCIWIVSQWTLVRDTATASHDQHLANSAAATAIPCPQQQNGLSHSSGNNNNSHNSANLQHHFNQSQSNYILSIHFVISTERSSDGCQIECGVSGTTAITGPSEEDRLACELRLLLSDTDTAASAVVNQLTPATTASSSAAPLPPDSSLQGTLASQLLLSSTTTAASFLSSAVPAAVEKITATDSVFAPRTEDMSSGFLMLTGDDKSPLTIIHDTDIETDAHDLTHLAPEVGDSDSFPLDLDSIPFDGFDMDELLGLSARTDAADCRPLASSTSTPDSLTPTTAGMSDSAFCGSSEGSSPFSFDSRCSPADEFSHRHLQEVMSGGSANCSPFSLESDSSDQFKHQDEDQNVTSDGAHFPFSLESLVSDVVVSSPGEEDPDIMMMPFCRSSSIGDSPPSSSRSFDCDSDLDLYSNCNTDLGLFTDDTFLDSLLTSNLPDAISNAADDLMSSLHHCHDSAAANSGQQMSSQHMNSSGNNNNSRDFFLPSLTNTKLPPPLPLTSSLATLLQQKTTLSGSTSSSHNHNANHNNIRAGVSAAGSSKLSLKGTGHGNSTHATNSHILVQNGQHFTIYKILAAAPSSGTAAGSGTVTSAQSSASITSQMDMSTSHKGVAKRFLTGVSSQLPPNKRIHVDSGSFGVHHPKPVNGNSVLMNLLVNGEDVRNGYTSRKSNTTASSSSSGGGGVRSGTTIYSCPFD